MANKVKKPFTARMRQVHRVLGYLAAGLVMVYALSGITLLFRTTDFLKHSDTVEQVLPAGLDADGLAAELKIKGFKAKETTDSTIVFEQGSYNRLTGAAVYEKKEVVSPMRVFIDLHKMSVAKSATVAWLAAVFGLVLFLLALTSLLMYPVRTRQFKINMLLTAVGVGCAILLLAAS